MRLLSPDVTTAPLDHEPLPTGRGRRRLPHRGGAHPRHRRRRRGRAVGDDRGHGPRHRGRRGVRRGLRARARRRSRTASGSTSRPGSRCGSPPASAPCGPSPSGYARSGWPEASRFGHAGRFRAATSADASTGAPFVARFASMTEPLVVLDGRQQALRRPARAPGHRPHRRHAARSSSSSARPARASPRCAARSTGSRPIDSGTITIDGKPLPEEGKALAQLRADVGMVFQSLQPLRAQDDPRERHARPDQGPQDVAKADGREAGHGAARPGRRRRTRPTSTPPSSPAASSSASPSPARWPWTPR